MKPKNPLPWLAALTPIAATLSLTASTYAASDSWDGSTDTAWANTSNWLLDISPPGAGETATFNSAGNGNTTIDLGAGVTLGSLVFDSSNAAAYTIGSGAVGSQTLSLGSALGNVITMNSTVAANQLFNSNLLLAVSSTANNQATYYAVTNSSLTNTLTIAGGVSAGTGGVKTLHLTGAGNTNITGAITSGSGNVSIFKTGSGTLTLSGGATWSGAGITDGSNFTTSAVFREGTTILNGGTYGNSNGELVIGGLATHGGAGTNTTLQISNGTTLNNISWLSIGRGNGNGNGTATSNLTLNGNASVTTTNLSAGFNAGNAGNLPKGSITLNNTSTLTVTSTATGNGGAATFVLGESAGSDFTLTVNDSAVLNRSGGNVGLAGNSQNQGAIQIGREGKGTVVMNGGTINVASTDLGRGVNNATAQNGTLTIQTGATYNNEGDFRMAFAGGASGQATLNLQGGTLNIGTTTARTMVIGTFDGPSATVNVDSGNLNLNTNTSIRFNAQGNVGTKIFNLNGGAVTSYSDNHTTANGSGVLDMMQAGAAGSNNTFNLNGGTLAVRQVVSTTNNGTRTFNFNGGTLKATGDTTALVSLGTGNARANVRNGGAIINTNGFNATIGQALLHSNVGGDNDTDGGLTKQGAGTLTLNGVNTYTGKTTVTGGSLALGTTGSIANSSEIALNGGDFNVSAVAGFTLGASQTLTGNGGSVTGDIIVNGTLAIGNSPGTMTFNDDLTIGSSAISNFELTDNSFGIGTYDLAQSGIGAQTVTFGGILNLYFSGGTYANNASVQIFNFDNYSGNFTAVNFSGLGVGQSATFDSSTGFVTVVPEPGAALLGGVGMLVLLRRRRD